MNDKKSRIKFGKLISAATIGLGILAETLSLPLYQQIIMVGTSLIIVLTSLYICFPKAFKKAVLATLVILCLPSVYMVACFAVVASASSSYHIPRQQVQCITTHLTNCSFYTQIPESKK